MKMKKFLMMLLISVFSFAEIPQAFPIPLNVTYKQGIYDISQFDGYTATAKLITADKFFSILLIDSNYEVKFYKRFNNVNEVVTIGVIQKGDIGVGIGPGEVNVNHEKEQSMMTFVKILQAPQLPLSGTFKQGIYDISQFAGYTITAKLTNPNTIALLVRIDSTGNLKDLIRFENINEIVKLGTIKEGDTGVILGTGNVSITHSK